MYYEERQRLARVGLRLLHSNVGRCTYSLREDRGHGQIKIWTDTVVAADQHAVNKESVSIGSLL